MARSAKKESVEERLEAVSALRHESEEETLDRGLRAGLGDKHNLIVARAAKVAASLHRDALIPELVAAWDALMVAPAKRDRGAQAAEAIVRTLLTFEAPATDVFGRGIHHVQMESAWGGPVDVAIEVRANSAIGLARCGGSAVVVELVPLLVDGANAVRIAAARAIAASGRVDAAAVLKLKTLTGDDEPEVVLECLLGFIQLEPEDGLSLAERFLSDDSAPLRQAAVLALGESRSAAAVQLLRRHEQREIDRDCRRSLLLALGTSRHEDAFERLFELIEEGHPGDALLAVDALRPWLGDSQLHGRLRSAVESSPQRRELERHMDRED